MGRQTICVFAFSPAASVVASEQTWLLQTCRPLKTFIFMSRAGGRAILQCYLRNWVFKAVF